MRSMASPRAALWRASLACRDRRCQEAAARRLPRQREPAADLSEDAARPLRARGAPTRCSRPDARSSPARSLDLVLKDQPGTRTTRRWRSISTAARLQQAGRARRRAEALGRRRVDVQRPAARARARSTPARWRSWMPARRAAPTRSRRSTRCASPGAATISNSPCCASSASCSSPRATTARRSRRCSGAALNFPDNPAAKDVAKETSDAFASLFLGDKGNDLPPLKALALYDQFHDLEPVGERSDQIVKKLIDRLVAVDLLDRAAGFSTSR